MTTVIQPFCLCDLSSGFLVKKRAVRKSHGPNEGEYEKRKQFPSKGFVPFDV
jgi:hypothetical protein